jgi:Ras GTPase-activating protein 1
MRSLVMIAKCLQVVNPFILKNKERMVVFLDHLSSVREKPYPDEDRVKGDPARDLATIHHICEGHLDELNDISKENMVQIKTLVTVTEMLSKHKQKYTEMLASSS